MNMRTLAPFGIGRSAILVCLGTLGTLLSGCTATLYDGREMPLSQVAELETSLQFRAILDGNGKPLPKVAYKRRPVLLPSGHYTMVLKVPKEVPAMVATAEYVLWGISGNLEGGQTYEIQATLAAVELIVSSRGGAQLKGAISGVQLAKKGSKGPSAGEGRVLSQEEFETLVGRSPTPAKPGDEATKVKAGGDPSAEEATPVADDTELETKQELAADGSGTMRAKVQERQFGSKLRGPAKAWVGWNGKTSWAPDGGEVVLGMSRDSAGKLSVKSGLLFRPATDRREDFLAFARTQGSQPENVARGAASLFQGYDINVEVALVEDDPSARHGTSEKSTLKIDCEIPLEVLIQRLPRLGTNSRDSPVVIDALLKAFGEMGSGLKGVIVDAVLGPLSGPREKETAVAYLKALAFPPTKANLKAMGEVLAGAPAEDVEDLKKMFIGMQGEDGSLVPTAVKLLRGDDGKWHPGGNRPPRARGPAAGAAEPAASPEVETFLRGVRGGWIVTENPSSRGKLFVHGSSIGGTLTDLVYLVKVEEDGSWTVYRPRRGLSGSEFGERVGTTKKPTSVTIGGCSCR